MSNPNKGIVVALATVVVLAIQISLLDVGCSGGDWHAHVALLAVIALPCGAYAGSFAGRLREDRFLQIAALGLAIPACLGFVTIMVHQKSLTPLAGALLATAVIPISIAAAALERWTRPPAQIPLAVPERFPASPRGPSWRRPSSIELAVALAMLVCAVLAVMISLTDHPAPDEYSHWHMYRSAVELDQPHHVFVFLAGLVLPIAVVLGRLAATLANGRLLSLIAVGAVGAAWVGSLVGVFTPLELRGSYLLLPVVVVVVLERVARPRVTLPPLGGVGLGAWIGAANAIAISAAMFVLVLSEVSRLEWEIMIIPCIALLFSVPAGAILGGIANGIRVNRLLVLELIALGGVLFLALLFELPIWREASALAILLWTCCTTAIGVFILERATRSGSDGSDSDPNGAGTREALRHAEGAGGRVVRGERA